MLEGPYYLIRNRETYIEALFKGPSEDVYFTILLGDAGNRC